MVVKQFLSELSGVSIEKFPDFPVFFVDCYPYEENQDTKQNLTLFHEWVCSRTPLDPTQFEEKY